MSEAACFWGDFSKGHEAAGRQRSSLDFVSSWPAPAEVLAGRAAGRGLSPSPQADFSVPGDRSQDGCERDPAPWQQLPGPSFLGFSGLVPRTGALKGTGAPRLVRGLEGTSHDTLPQLKPQHKASAIKEPEEP